MMKAKTKTTTMRTKNTEGEEKTDQHQIRRNHRSLVAMKKTKMKMRKMAKRCSIGKRAFFLMPSFASCCSLLLLWLQCQHYDHRQLLLLLLLLLLKLRVCCLRCHRVGYAPTADSALLESDE